MTKITLTFHDLTAASAAALINFSTGGAGSAVSSVAVPSGDDDESDDSGPINHAAPALDSKGLPWDARIHASTKSQNKDGSWKKLKGATADLTASVEAELRARVASPMPQTAPAQPGPFVPPVQPAPVAFPSPGPQPAQPQAAQPVHMQPPAPQPQMQAAPTVAPTTPQPAPSQPDFNSFMLGLQNAMTAGKLDQSQFAAYVAEANTAWQTNLNLITDLITRPDMIPWVIQCLQRDGRWVN